jgi:hypothetical protein
MSSPLWNQYISKDGRKHHYKPHQRNKRGKAHGTQMLASDSPTPLICKDRNYDSQTYHADKWHNEGEKA